MHFIRAVTEGMPQFRLILTSSHPGTVEWLRARFVDDMVTPAPWDFISVVRHFFKLLAPSVIILLDSAKGFGSKAMSQAITADIPVIAVTVREQGGRLSEHFLSALISPHLKTYVCVQDRPTAEALIGKGVLRQKISVTGDLTFEYTSPAENADREHLRESLGLMQKIPVIVAEKILPEEESMVADLFCELGRSYPDLVLLLEPRYRSQIRRIISTFKKRKVVCELRSQGVREKKSKVLLFDIPGELQAFYKIAICVLAGGSFSNKDVLIHVIGPASAGTPVLLGPHLGSDPRVSRLFIDHEAALQIQPSGIAEEIDKLIRFPELSEKLSLHASQLIQSHRGASRKTCDAIKKWMPLVPYEPPVKQLWRVRTRRDLAGQSTLWKNIAPIFTKRRIDDWDALKSRLHHPESILCLGNGPSSEDPQVMEIEHDCLMRVNWRWKLRGILTRPDIVFVGDAKTLHKLPSCIFAFWNIWLEYGMLLRYFVTHGPKRMEYITLERMSPIIQEPNWHARPSNGALMVVAGAALQPKRLIIAGIDLFLHPDGRYPGELRAYNQYAQTHLRIVDLAIIDRALKGYQGELIILSDILRNSLSELKEEKDVYIG
jgi:3-deoxy-D-manno-octulosonic-acid transferase